MDSSEVEIKEDIIVLPISFGNPSNEIIYGELRLSRNEEHINPTVAMIDIPTEIDLKEIFAFLQKSSSSFKITHIKILNQEDTTNNGTNPSESYYSLLCSFTTIQHSETFIKDLNGACFNAQLTATKCSIYYLINSELIINKQTKSKEMHFPPPRITTAELIKQNSNPKTYGNDEDNIANCGCCLDSVVPLFSPQASPKSKYKLFHGPFDTSRTPSPPPNYLHISSKAPPESKWYDAGNTVCFVLCGHFFHVMCLMRCEQNSCPICRHYLFPEPSSVCNSCSLCTKDLWVCLTCGHVGCGRCSNQCAVQHFHKTSHVWAKCLSTSHVWDYADDDYVYRILMAEMLNDGATKLVSLQMQTEDGIDGSSKHLPQELDVMSSIKQEELISEYNFVVQDRLKRLQTFHKAKRHRVIKNAEHRLTKLEHDIERMQKEIETKKRNNAELVIKNSKKYKGDGEQVFIEFVDDIEYLRKQLEEERERSDKLKKMKHRVFVEQKTFNEKLKEYENTLKQSLTMTERTLNAEINDMKSELKDYQAHVDTSNKMKRMVATTDLDGALVSVKPGKTKNNQKREMKNKPHSNKKTKKSRKTRK